MRIGPLVFDGMTMLDASGPAEVFNLADSARQHFEVAYISPQEGGSFLPPGWSSRATLAAADGKKVDTLLVVGGPSLPDAGVPTNLLEAVAGLAAGAWRVVSVCTVAFVLAELGHLDGQRATTHWRQAHTLATRYPLINLDEDVIHVRDGRYLPSAGSGAGSDLALAMAENDLGVRTARETARELVAFMHRPGGQAQFSTALSTLPVPNALLRALMESVLANLADDTPSTPWQRSPG